VFYVSRYCNFIFCFFVIELCDIVFCTASFEDAPQGDPSSLPCLKILKFKIINLHNTQSCSVFRRVFFCRGSRVSFGHSIFPATKRKNHPIHISHDSKGINLIRGYAYDGGVLKDKILNDKSLL